MTDLQGLRDFAAQHEFGLTYPLTHAQVEILATYWQPDVAFHPDERYRPISLDERIDVVEIPFGGMPEAEQSLWRISKFVRISDNEGRVREFDPSIVHVPDGAVSPVGEPERIDAAVCVINDGSPVRAAFDDPTVDEDAVFTRGVSAARARKFFRAERTLAGEEAGKPGNGLLPRAGDITVMASYKNLLDLLKYELLVEGAGDYPPDALRGGFNVAELSLRSSLGNETGACGLSRTRPAPTRTSSPGNFLEGGGWCRDASEKAAYAL
jgi:hypothetical protein